MPCVLVYQIPADVGLLAREPGCTFNLFIVEGHSERNGTKSRSKYIIDVKHFKLLFLF